MTLEKMILIISVCFIVLGMPALFFLIYTVDLHSPPTASVITLEGTVDAVFPKKKVTIFTVEPKESVPIVVFNQDVEKGQYVTIKGRMKEYNGKVEFIADTIS